mgnify:CR=1 FL=1
MVSSMDITQINLNEIVNSIDEKQGEKKQLNDETIQQLHHSSIDDTVMNNEDGYIESRNGELFIRSPMNNGKYPTIIPHQNIRIFINDRLITKETAIKERDEVSWFPKNEENFSISISKDKLKVYLKLHENIMVSFRLKDKKRTLKFVFDLEEIEKQIDIDKMSSKIIDEIFKKGVKCDINMSAILIELRAPTFKPIIVAEGLPIIESRDGFIQTNFSSTLEVSLEEVSGKVDFKNIFKIPNVDAGEIIATVFEPLEGRDGYDVYGKVLNTNIPKKVEVRTKARTELKEDGSIVALQSGRPTVTGTSIKYFDVLLVHEIRGDVDVKTGNIMFNGDVIVHGHVKDNMRIDALGNVYIKGNIYLSTVVSAQNIYIEGAVINSKVFAGQQGILLNQLYKLLQDLLFLFSRLTSVVDQVLETIAQEKLSYSVGQIIVALIDQKFTEYHQLLDKFFNIINIANRDKIEVPISIQVLYRILTHIKTRDQLFEIADIIVFENIKSSLKESIFKAESSILPNSEIYLKEADASEIKANGSVYVTGKGTVSSTLFAGKSVIFQKNKSVVRGGVIEAVYKIIAGEVGSPTGRAPELNAGEQIEIRKLIHAKIRIQDDVRLLFDPKENVIYSLEETTQKIISYSIDDKD